MNYLFWISFNNFLYLYNICIKFKNSYFKHFNLNLLTKYKQ